jgi:predicted O-methyltransferase YrrM|tara:strand:+ start:476 stop:1132 length:657 start_codon:yes stop_codon:yes gene_type:complete
MLKNIEVTKDLLNYIYNHTKPLHHVQKDILEHNKNLGDLQRMQIAETQAHFLQLIIKINNVKNCLEIGTFTGFSALTMAMALPSDGKLITLDHDEKVVKVAKNFFKKGNLESKIETIVAPALDSLKKIIQEKKIFDLIFIDADKGNYINYYESCLNLINNRSLIIFDNVLWHGNVYKKSITDKQTNTIRDFNEFIKNDTRIEKFILPIGDGLTVCRKL